MTPRNATDQEIIDTAKTEYLGRFPDGDLDFDDTPTVSRGDDGAYVAAWVWVPFEDDDNDPRLKSGAGGKAI